MAGKIFWDLACNREMQITPLPPASCCPARPHRRGSVAAEGTGAGCESTTACVSSDTSPRCSAPLCLVGTAPRSLSSTHHTEMQPGDTDALATNLPEQIWDRNSPTALSGALRTPARSLPDNSHVEDRNEVQISAQTWAQRAPSLKPFCSPICKMETTLLVDLQG